MGAIPPRGAETALAATWMGEGWRPRQRTHAQEIGALWHPCGVDSEYGTLRSVLLTRPRALCFGASPDEQLLLARIDERRLAGQGAEIERFFRAHGVETHVLEPAPRSSPNLVFLRDLFLMTPEGAILGRPAAEQRGGEEVQVAATLAGLGIPLLRTIRGQGTFEGADALWLEPDVVLIGTGRRTNSQGAEQVAACLAELGVRTRRIPLPPGRVQHLLGIVGFLAADLAVLDPAHATDRLRGVLAEHGVRALEPTDHQELSERRGANFVALRERELVMPAGAPHTRELLREAGAVVHELDVSEYVRAAGGLACLTGIVEREPRAHRSSKAAAEAKSSSGNSSSA